MTDGAVFERVRLHGLDLSTKHVEDDPREPEIEKPAFKRAISNEGIAMRLYGRRYPGWVWC